MSAGGGIRIEYAAPQRVRDAVESLGRTEDVRFSPDNRRLAVADFSRNKIVVFGIEITGATEGPHVALTGAVELSSSALRRPHGLDFIDDATLIVANREGDIAVFKLPEAGRDARSVEVRPVQTWKVDDLDLLAAPASVVVADAGPGRREVLICNNDADTVTRHELDAGVGFALSRSEVLLRRWLHVPDGVTVSDDRRWLAVSNHDAQQVLVYEQWPSLDSRTDPCAVLAGAGYPHGLHFTSDGRHLCVADAGSPVVNVYTRRSGDWFGVQQPSSSVRVMDDSQFALGHVNGEEGGPKGIDIDVDSGVLAVTSKFQHLAFFDLSAILRLESRQTTEPDTSLSSEGHVPSQRERQASAVYRELSLTELKHRARVAEAGLESVTKSISWRVTAPLRALGAGLRRLR